MVRRNDFPQLTAASKELAEAQIFFHDAPFRSIAELEAAAEQTKREHDIRLLIVDDVQLVTNKTAREKHGPFVEVKFLALRLKRIAVELDRPLLALCPLDRNIQYSDDDLVAQATREAVGAVGWRFADMVCFLERASGDETGAQLIIAKNHSGPTGTVKVRFKGRTA